MSLASTFPALPVLAWTLLALFTKTTLTSVLQVLGRARAGVFPIAEDARLMRGRAADAEAPFVRRCANVWRNDTENLPLFFALATTYVLLGAQPTPATALFGAYVVLRYAHTAMFLLGLQPWRALCYLGGLGICWIVAVHSVLLA